MRKARALDVSLPLTPKAAQNGIRKELKSWRTKDATRLSDEWDVSIPAMEEWSLPAKTINEWARNGTSLMEPGKFEWFAANWAMIMDYGSEIPALIRRGFHNGTGHKITKK